MISDAMRYAPVTIPYVKRLCPYCGHHFGIILDRSAIRLGPGTRTCDNCGEIFADGSIEWPELTQDQKRQFLFGDLRWLAFFIGGFALLVILVGINEPGGGKFISMILEALVGLGIGLLGVFYLICGLHIWRSKKRYLAAKEG
jgi:hypothetical protein